MSSKLAAILNKKGITAYDGEYPNIERVSTGLVSLDNSCGGGLPLGRIIQLYGPSSGGKTTLACAMLLAHQQRGGETAYIDIERTVEEEWILRVGLNNPENKAEKLLLIPASSAEKAFNAMFTILENTREIFIVVDSVSMLLPQAKLEGDDLEKAQVAPTAQFLKKVLGRLNALVADSNSVVIFINHIGTSIGGYTSGMETVPGGLLLRFVTSVLMRVSKTKELPGKDGVRVSVTIKKNKVGVPFKTCELDLYYESSDTHTAGFDAIASLAEAAVESGVITRAGAWYSIDGMYLKTLELEPNNDKGTYRVQGMAQVVSFLKENTEIKQKIFDIVGQKLIIKVDESEVDDFEEPNQDILEDFDTRLESTK